MIKIEGFTVHISGELPMIMFELEQLIRSVKEGIENESGPEFAKECIKEGWYLSLGGVVTFKNAKKMKEVAKEIPLEHLMLETDAPYLAPVPFRGKINEPKYIPYIAQEIADLKETSLQNVTNVTTKNAEKVFRIWKKKD